MSIAQNNDYSFFVFFTEAEESLLWILCPEGYENLAASDFHIEWSALDVEIHTRRDKLQLQ